MTKPKLNIDIILYHSNLLLKTISLPLKKQVNCMRSSQKKIVASFPFAMLLLPVNYYIPE
jgi:hypothetical protein